MAWDSCHVRFLVCCGEGVPGRIDSVSIRFVPWGLDRSHDDVRGGARVVNVAWRGCPRVRLTVMVVGAGSGRSVSRETSASEMERWNSGMGGEINRRALVGSVDWSRSVARCVVRLLRLRFWEARYTRCRRYARLCGSAALRLCGPATL